MVMIVGVVWPEALPVFGVRLFFFVIPGELGLRTRPPGE